jgi:hypothetical protein
MFESQKIDGIEKLLVFTWGTGWSQFPPDLVVLILGLRAPNIAKLHIGRQQG